MNAELAEMQSRQVASNARVLVVDDESRILTSLEALLKYKHYQVDTALGGDLACQKLTQNQYDIVLLDLNMGDFDGYAVMAHMAEHNIDTAVVVVSGEIAFDAVRKALRMGASDYVKKPYSSAELFTTIAATLQKKNLRDERDRYQERIRKSVALNRYIVDHSPDIVFLLSVDGLFNFSNPQMQNLLGYSYDELAGTPFKNLLDTPNLQVDKIYEYSSSQVAADALCNVELCLRHRNDTSGKKYFEVTLFSVYTDIIAGAEIIELKQPSRKLNVLSAIDDNFTGYYGTARDITERKKAEGIIRFQADHDLLTGLPNRSLFNDRLDLAIVHSRRRNKMLAVMYLDLDRFKNVNDTFGHTVGDLLLQAVVTRLHKCLREGDTLSRYGGDEFVLLLPEIDGAADAELIAHKIMDVLKQPFKLQGQELSACASIGAALFPEFGGNIDTLIRHADIAMYVAKAKGNNSYALFDHAMGEHLDQSIKLEVELRQALANEELRVFYQPQTCTRSNAVIGVEALVRWQHPERGLICPSEFIAMAEDTKMIFDLGDWVVRHAVAEVKSWMDQGLPPLRLAVNFSSLQVDQANLVDKVISTLSEFDFPPHYFELEITENSMMHDLEGMVKKMQNLSDHGITVAIDDFGTGYSSLSYLHTLPIHTVKLDQSFVRNIESVDLEVSIVNAICAMAHGLGLNIVAEGVESQSQYDYLKNLGCQQVQGYLISRPLSGTAFLQFLADRQSS
ncbi:MAG: diguanylate cyclase (GGDEF)-like protein [Pseudohongiellaceae bacterium]|jgi:diguanylate cyclase (GGDEF)-like protein